MRENEENLKPSPDQPEENLADRLSERLAQRMAEDRSNGKTKPEFEEGFIDPLMRIFTSLSRDIALGLNEDPAEIGRVDDFGMEEGFRARVRHFLEFLYTYYWRVQVEGLENVPSDGRAMLVSNHSGALPFDAFMVSHTIERDHPSHRIIRPLLEDIFSTSPYLSVLMSRYGIVRACQENGQRLLDEDRLICVFPEGIKGAIKHYRDRYRMLRFGRGGFVRLACRTNAPIIPVSVVGAEEIYPIVARTDWINRRLGTKLLPITLQFPWLGPLSFVPLPSKWWIDFGEPMELSEIGVESEDDDIAINQAKEHVRARIQWMVIERLKKRNTIWRG